MRKIKIKDSLYILKEKDDIYDVIFTGTRRIKKFKVDSLVRDVLGMLESQKDEGELAANLRKYNPVDVNSCINSLEKFGVLRRYEDKDLEFNERYSKQILFIDELTESWSETMNLHRKITSSKFAVFGVGGIGTWIVNGLYQMGVDEIRVVDPDIVNKSNLNRQLFFNSRDVGRYKVDVIKEKLFDANIIPFKREISKDSSLDDIVKGVSFMVNCADKPSVSETTEIINKYAIKENIPYCVAGGYNMHLGMVGPIIIPGETKTFQEFLDYQKRNDPFKDMEKIKDIENPGNVGPVAGAVANMQLMEIFKHIIGKGTHNYNRFAEFDFMDFSIDWREF